MSTTNKTYLTCLWMLVLIWISLTFLFLLYYFPFNNNNTDDAFNKVLQSQCNQKYGAVNLQSHTMTHSNELALIVGNKAFTNMFAEFCSAKLGLQTITKTLQRAASFWVIDSDEFVGKAKDLYNANNNLIHAPFHTNKEHQYRYDVRTFDYIYCFINCYNNIDLKSTFELIEYANKINITCFILITNCLNDMNDIQMIQSYLIYSKLNYIIFPLNNVYIPIANDSQFSSNHIVALLMHQIIEDNNINLNIFNNELHILYFNDIMPYLAISPFYQHLYGETFAIGSKHIFSSQYLQNKMRHILQLNNDNNDNNNNINMMLNSHKMQKFNCFFLANAQKYIHETSIDDILIVIKRDLDKNKDLISRKRDFQRFDKSAVLCDNRFDDDMVKIVLNFMINLHQSWQFQLFVTNETKTLWQNHPYLSPYFKTEKIILEDLNKFYKDNVLQYYENMEFWQSIKYEKILLFQTDSVLCSNSKYKIEDFLHYDYVGAPWKVKDKEFNGRVGNGGLSLRSKRIMVDLLQTYPRNKQLKEFQQLNEDCYLNKFIALLPGVHLPRYLIAKRFATEMDFDGLYGHGISAGMHRHFVKNKKDWNALTLRCVEFNMTYKRIKFGRSPNLID